MAKAAHAVAHARVLKLFKFKVIFPFRSLVEGDFNGIRNKTALNMLAEGFPGGYPCSFLLDTWLPRCEVTGLWSRCTLALSGAVTQLDNMAVAWGALPDECGFQGLPILCSTWRPQHSPSPRVPIEQRLLCVSARQRLAHCFQNLALYVAV